MHDAASRSTNTSSGARTVVIFGELLGDLLRQRVIHSDVGKNLDRVPV